MPEIGEVARIVHYLRKHLLNRRITHCEAFADDIVYGKCGTTAAAFAEAVQGRTVTGAAQQGKYFYMTFDRSPHAVMHLGMTGWIKFSTEDTAYYKQAKEKEKGQEEWPPKYMKFLLKCDAEGDREALEVAFVDARRLARIRLVDCEADGIRNATPLKENGPDPVRDKDIVTVEWLKNLLGRKRVPVKALLLDQANLSGVGNWVADEVLYQAKIHPEQYSNTFSDAQIKQLHTALTDVCTLAVETLADSKQFPETWLMKYRWDKGKKDSNVLPNGEKIVHLKVGGRTSAIVPSVQKKTGAVAGDVEEDGEKPPTKVKKRKVKDEDEVEGKGVAAAKPARRATRGKRAKYEESEDDADEDADADAGAEANGSEDDSIDPAPKKPTRKAAANVKKAPGKVKAKAKAKR